MASWIFAAEETAGFTVIPKLTKQTNNPGTRSLCLYLRNILVIRTPQGYIEKKPPDLKRLQQNHSIKNIAYEMDSINRVTFDVISNIIFKFYILSSMILRTDAKNYKITKHFAVMFVTTSCIKGNFSKKLQVKIR